MPDNSLKEQYNNEELAFLVYLNAHTCDFILDIFENKNSFCSVENFLYLTDIFINKFNGSKNLIFLACAKETPLFKRLVQSESNIKITDYKHELGLIKDIFEKNNKVKYVAFFEGINPLFDLSYSARLFNAQKLYDADYAYFENIPSGISPVFFGKTILEQFSIEDENGFIPDDLPVPLKTYIEKNLNKFHAEIDFIEPDLRMLRLDFSCANSRSFIKTSALAKEIKNIEKPFDEIENILSAKPSILFNLPSYLEVELTTKCQYNCTFCPRQIKKPADISMTEENFESILDFFSESMNDTSICLGGLGEPLEHENIEIFLNNLFDNEKVKYIILETNGLYLDKIFSLLEHKNIHKFRILINYNGISNYESIHGTEIENKNKVNENLKNLTEIFKNNDYDFKEKVYIQTLKIIDNENDIDEIFELCESLGISFLLQKYNSYIHKMPEKRVSDMTPLERSPCWHLRRDMFIRADGAVSLCKQDIENNVILGNISKESVLEIRKKASSYWEKNFVGGFEEIPDCNKCDEYFTFNL